MMYPQGYAMSMKIAKTRFFDSSTRAIVET